MLCKPTQEPEHIHTLAKRESASKLTFSRKQANSSPLVSDYVCIKKGQAASVSGTLLNTISEYQHPGHCSVKKVSLCFF